MKFNFPLVAARMVAGLLLTASVRAQADANTPPEPLGYTTELSNPDSVSPHLAGSYTNETDMAKMDHAIDTTLYNSDDTKGTSWGDWRDIALKAAQELVKRMKAQESSQTTDDDYAGQFKDNFGDFTPEHQYDNINQGIATPADILYPAQTTNIRAPIKDEGGGPWRGGQ